LERQKGETAPFLSKKKKVDVSTTDRAQATSIGNVRQAHAMWSTVAIAALGVISFAAAPLAGASAAASSNTHTIAMRRGVAGPPRGTQELGEAGDLLWLGVVSIGTPPQEFAVTMDTGSSDLLVVGSLCASAECRQKRGFNWQTSTTFGAETGPTGQQNSVKESYGGGNARCHYGVDEVSVSGLKARQKFLIIDTLDMQGAYFRAWTGILGLTFGNVDPKRPTTFLSSLCNAKNITRKTVSFALREGNTSGVVQAGGELVLGATPWAKEVDVWVPLRNKPSHTWLISLYNFRLGGAGSESIWGADAATPLNCPYADACAAYPDSGTSLIGMPPGVFDKVLGVMTESGQCFKRKAGVTSYACHAGALSTLPSITFDFGEPGDLTYNENLQGYGYGGGGEAVTPFGGSVTLAPKDYLFAQAADEATFSLPFFRLNASESNFWLLGDRFFVNRKVVFDYDAGRVGFSGGIRPVQPTTVIQWPFLLGPFALLVGFMAITFAVQGCRRRKLERNHMYAQHTSSIYAASGPLEGPGDDYDTDWRSRPNMAAPRRMERPVVQATRMETPVVQATHIVVVQ